MNPQNRLILVALISAVGTFAASWLFLGHRPLNVETLQIKNESLRKQNQNLQSQVDLLEQQAALLTNVVELEKQRADQLTAAVNGQFDIQMQKASKAHMTGKLDEAIQYFDAALKVDPTRFEAYLTRGVARQQQGDWRAALADYETARRINPDDYAPWNNLAMLLAACPDNEIRNGATAAEYARKACELTEWEHAPALHTLAIAYGELGDWQAATDICDEQLGKLSDSPAADEFRAALELLKREEKYRLPEG